MIEPTLDKTENIGFHDFCMQTAEACGITDSERVKAAAKAGWKMYNDFLEMTQSGIPYKDALENALSGKFVKNPLILSNRFRLLLWGMVTTF